MYILRGTTVKMRFLEGQYMDGSFIAGTTKKLGIWTKIYAEKGKSQSVLDQIFKRDQIMCTNIT